MAVCSQWTAMDTINNSIISYRVLLCIKDEVHTIELWP